MSRTRASTNVPLSTQWEIRSSLTEEEKALLSFFMAPGFENVTPAQALDQLKHRIHTEVDVDYVEVQRPRSWGRAPTPRESPEYRFGSGEGPFHRPNTRSQRVPGFIPLVPNP